MRINSLVFIMYQQHPQKLQFTKPEIKALNSKYAYLFKTGKVAAWTEDVLSWFHYILKWYLRNKFLIEFRMNTHLSEAGQGGLDHFRKVMGRIA